MSEEEIEEISDEEKLKISQYFLLSSPPGQFQEILADVRKLVPPGLVTDELATGVARTFNVKNNKVVISPAGNKIPLSLTGEVDPTHQVDPVANIVFEVNHLSLTSVEANGYEPKPRGSMEPMRAALQARVTDYVSSNFPAELAGGAVYENDSTLVVVITGEKPNLRNFWSGKWSSSWTIQMDTGMISGEIKVHAHYFEDGNFQLQTVKAIDPASVNTSSPEELASSAISFIRTAESQLQSGFEEMYNNMNDETFKAMRRIMPIMKTKMEWNINAVKMIRQVRK